MILAFGFLFYFNFGEIFFSKISEPIYLNPSVLHEVLLKELILDIFQNLR